MDRVRSAFNGVMRSERYSRFTLQPAEDGERCGEVNLSDAAEEHGSPSFRPAPLQQNRRWLICLVLGTALLLLLGLIVGGATSRKHQAKPPGCEPKTTSAPPEAQPAEVQPQLDWKDLTKALADQLTKDSLEVTLRNLDLSSRSAGSPEDLSLGNRVFATFAELQMNPWTDIHYVELPRPDSKRPNLIQFGSEVFKPSGFLAYSTTGRVQGRLVYANYGRQTDLDLVEKITKVEGCVLLIRAGNFSFAEQVENGARRGASAVLIYPDVEDFHLKDDIELYGHVHLGSGDPYTPGFPSFNHTQFAPTQSSGLPKILAQTITAKTAKSLFQQIGGPEAEASSGFKGKLSSVTYSLGGAKNITVEVNNQLVSTEIHNIFGVIKGFSDPDRFVVLGAQRDAWGPGYAKATVGTSVLLELAKAFHAMVEKQGFRPRRSIVFASWSAGEYGSIGATEWLEGYMSSIDKKVFTYISLDGMVMGRGSLIASASPLLLSLMESTMKEVEAPVGSGTLYEMMGGARWEEKVMRPMAMDDPAYPFMAFSGIPSVSFHFITSNAEYYTYYGTLLDNNDHLNYQTNQHTAEITATAARFAGLMALRLVHDHLLSLDVSRYGRVLTRNVYRVNKRVQSLLQSGELKDVGPGWLSRARGSFQRAAESIISAVQNTDLTDPEACRILNDRIMKVEHCLLSPYVSPVETPFRHIVFGRGSHTLASIATSADMEGLRTQLALATWNLQSCSDAMMGNIWELDNEI